MCTKCNLEREEAKKIAAKLGIKNQEKVIGGTRLQGDEKEGIVNILFLRGKAGILIHVSGPDSKKIALVRDVQVVNRFTTEKPGVLGPHAKDRVAAMQQAGDYVGLGSANMFALLSQAVKNLFSGQPTAPAPENTR